MAPVAGKIRILVVDDHTGMRCGIRAFIATQQDMELVGESGDGREAFELFRSVQPDVALVDLNLPDVSGLEVISGLLAEYPDARFLAMTGANDDEYLKLATEAGARGYLNKDSLRRELAPAIRGVHQGEYYLPISQSEPRCGKP